MLTMQRISLASTVTMYDLRLEYLEAHLLLAATCPYIRRNRGAA